MPEPTLLTQVKKWEDLFIALYKRKPKMIEREQFFFGMLFCQIDNLEKKCCNFGG